MSKRTFDKIVENRRMTVTNTVKNTTVLTAPDEYTLERLVGFFQWVQDEANAVVNCAFEVVIWPSGTSVYALAVDQQIDKGDSYWSLFKGQITTRTAATPDNYPVVVIPFDLTIRRKIEKDDLIVVRAISNSANANYLNFTATVILREY